MKKLAKKINSNHLQTIAPSGFPQVMFCLRRVFSLWPPKDKEKKEKKEMKKRKRGEIQKEIPPENDFESLLFVVVHRLQT